MMHQRAYALIKALVTAAQQQQMLVPGQFLRLGLSERFALRAKHHHLRGVFRQFLNCLKDRFGFEHHPRASAVGFIVHLTVTIVGPIPQIMHGQLEPTCFLCTLQDAFIHRPRKHRGKQREHIYLHGRSRVCDA